MRVPELLIEAIRNKICTPFVGAGLSKASAPNIFPTWNQLLLILATACRSNGIIPPNDLKIKSNSPQDTYERLGEFIVKNLPKDEYFRIMESVFDQSITTLDLRIQIELTHLNSKFVITTNYDRLIENALACTTRRTPEIHHHKNADIVMRKIRRLHARRTPLIFKIHGDIADPASLVLCTSDYSNLIHGNSVLTSLMQSIISTNTLLFIGYSASDRDLRMHLEKYQHQLNGSAYPHYILLSENSISASEEHHLRDHYGIATIKYRGAPNGTNLRRAIKAINDSVVN